MINLSDELKNDSFYSYQINHASNSGIFQQKTENSYGQSINISNVSIGEVVDPFHSYISLDSHYGSQRKLN